MIEHCSHKARIALAASLAANIFLVAFTLGRFTAPTPPHGFGDRPMMPPGMHDGPPHFMHPDGFMPPPSFGPPDLFTPEEMRVDEMRMHENFDKVDALRKDFAAQLQAGPVSKDDVLKHFADIDQVMGTVRHEAQERAADKISAMSPEERQKFAESLRERGGPR